MEISEDLSEKMIKNEMVINEIGRIREKLESSDVPKGKKEKLRYRSKVLEKKSKEQQRNLY